MERRARPQLQPPPSGQPCAALICRIKFNYRSSLCSNAAAAAASSSALALARPSDLLLLLRAHCTSRRRLSDGPKNNKAKIVGLRRAPRLMFASKRDHLARGSHDVVARRLSGAAAQNHRQSDSGRRRRSQFDYRPSRTSQAGRRRTQSELSFNQPKATTFARTHASKPVSR